MSEVIQNTLYLMTAGSYLSKDGETAVISIDREVKARIPFHIILNVVVFEEIILTPSLLHAFAERGISVTFLSYSGRLLCRVDAPGSGNVLLRRCHFRYADSTEKTLEFARAVVAGKVQNTRTFLLRASRDTQSEADKLSIREVINSLGGVISSLSQARTVDEVRGYEGRAAERYFSIFSKLIKQQNNEFVFTLRTRRPPLDPVNALLSFGYALLLNDCIAALTAVGLDISVGFLHTDRPGRPSLGLDLMEEFRALFVDRLVVRLINRREVKASGFVKREGGSVEMSEETKKRLIEAYQERKKDFIIHPLLEQETKIGLLPFIQARILARYIRDDIESYIPFLGTS